MVVGLDGKGPVNVVVQDGDAVLLRKGGTLSDLALNAFFPLAVGDIARISQLSLFALHHTEQSFFQLLIHGGPRVKAHLNKATFFLTLRGSLGLKLVCPSLGLVRPDKI